MKKLLLLIAALTLTRGYMAFADSNDYPYFRPAFEGERAQVLEKAFKYKPQPSVETVGAAGTITANACGGVKLISADAARSTSTSDVFTSTASLAASSMPCLMDLINVSTNTITLKHVEGKFASASHADVALGSTDTVRVVGISGRGWFQIGGTGNNH